MAHVRPGDNKAIGMDGIGWIRHQHGVAGPHRRQSQMGQALLGADGDDGLHVRVQFHLVAVAVPVADGPPQTRNAPGHGISVGITPLGRLHQFIDDVVGCGLVWIAHAEVDDVFPPRARGRLQLVDDVEDIGRQALDAAKFGDWSNHENLTDGVAGESRMGWRGKRNESLPPSQAE